MVKELFTKSNLKEFAAFLSGVFIVLFGNAYVMQDSNSEPVAQAVEISWPLENVNLFENQVFVVDLPNFDSNADNLKVFWSVENGALGGEMVHDYNSSFKSKVDVSNWDWKKDNKYAITFVAKDENGNVAGQSSVFVFVGDVSPEAVVLEEEVIPVKEPEVKPVVESEIKNGAAVYQPVIDKPVPVPVSVVAAQPVTVANNFSVTWVPSDIKNNQKFVFNTDGYNDNEISAYWNTGGGHKNLVFKTDPKIPFSAALNVFGWRWLDKGPYEISFTIADKTTSAVLASETFNMLWKGEPGESDIEMKSMGVSSPSIAGNKQLAQATEPVKLAAPIEPTTLATPARPLVLPEPVKPVVSNPAPSLITQSLLVNTSVNNFTKNKLFVPAKPAVERALSSANNRTVTTALKYILSQPNSVWLNGDGYDSDAYIQSVLNKAKSNNEIPAFVLYNIPNRDCGSHSSGGTASVNKYKSWIDRIAKNLSGVEAIVIVEPDALAMLNCLPSNGQADRLEMIKYAVEKIVPVSRNVMVYIDAGHPHWVDTAEMAKRLQKAGVQQARGFALNVSNYISTNDNIVYGNYISNLLGGKKYVIDSSRNGNGPSPTREWCNPSGRALGESPLLSDGRRGNLDAVLWIKFPGESDGTCNGGPSAGGWWTDYAVDLYKNR